MKLRLLTVARKREKRALHTFYWLFRDFFSPYLICTLVFVVSTVIFSKGFKKWEWTFLLHWISDSLGLSNALARFVFILERNPCPWVSASAAVIDTEGNNDNWGVHSRQGGVLLLMMWKSAGDRSCSGELHERGAEDQLAEIRSASARSFLFN